MAKFVFSAFADEIDSDFEEQLKALNKLGIGYIELRGVDGKSFVTLSDAEVAEVKAKLEKYKIKVWSLGSPIGKSKTDEVQSQLELLNRVMDIGDMLDVKHIRMFSYYREDGDSDEEFGKKSFSLMEKLVESAEKRGFVLCHENEKDIYGDRIERVKEISKHFGSRLKLILDPGNFVFSGFTANGAYEVLKDNIEYLHIKDCNREGIIVPPGRGDACLKEIFEKINKERETVVITIEPHLIDFIGLSGLAAKDVDIKHTYKFDTPYAAFECAVENVREMLKSL